MSGKSKRDPGVEAFRCLLMVLIVVEHAYDNGPWYACGAWWTLLTATFIHWHVDGFVGISGWFGIRPTLGRFVRLWCLMMFYNVLGCSITYLLWPEEFHWSQLLSLGGWFGKCYLALMLLAPFLNAAVERLSELPRKSAWHIWLGGVIMLTLTWLPGHLCTGVCALGSGQFSFLVMAFVYVTARFLRVMNVDFGAKRNIWVLMVFYLLVILLIGGPKSLLQLYRGLPQHAATWDWLTTYDAPHVWLFSMAMLMLFAYHIRLPLWLGRCCLFVAPSLFSVYLIHETTVVGVKTTRAFELWLFNLFGLNPLIIVLLTAAVVFCSCLMIDLIRRGALSFFWYRANRAFSGIDEKRDERLSAVAEVGIADSHAAERIVKHLEQVLNSPKEN